MQKPNAPSPYKSAKGILRRLVQDQFLGTGLLLIQCIALVDYIARDRRMFTGESYVLAMNSFLLKQDISRAFESESLSLEYFWNQVSIYDEHFNSLLMLFLGMVFSPGVEDLLHNYLWLNFAFLILSFVVFRKICADCSVRYPWTVAGIIVSFPFISAAARDYNTFYPNIALVGLTAVFYFRYEDTQRTKDLVLASAMLALGTLHFIQFPVYAIGLAAFYLMNLIRGGLTRKQLRDFLAATGVFLVIFLPKTTLSFFERVSIHYLSYLQFDATSELYWSWNLFLFPVDADASWILGAPADYVLYYSAAVMIIFYLACGVATLRRRFSGLTLPFLMLVPLLFFLAFKIDLFPVARQDIRVVHWLALLPFIIIASCRILQFERVVYPVLLTSLGGLQAIFTLSAMIIPLSHGHSPDSFYESNVGAFAFSPYLGDQKRFDALSSYVEGVRPSTIVILAPFENEVVNYSLELRQTTSGSGHEFFPLFSDGLTKRTSSSDQTVDFLLQDADYLFVQHVGPSCIDLVAPENEAKYRSIRPVRDALLSEKVTLELDRVLPVGDAHYVSVFRFLRRIE